MREKDKKNDRSGGERESERGNRCGRERDREAGTGERERDRDRKTDWGSREIER